MTDLIKTVVSEIAVFIAPLNAAVRDRDALQSFLFRFGFDVSPLALGGAVTALGPLATSAQGLIDQVEGDQAAGGTDNVDAAAVLAIAAQVFDALDAIGDAFTTVQDIVATPSLPELPSDVFAALLTDYLNTRSRVALQVVNLLAIRQEISITDPASPRWRGAPYAFSRYDWSMIGRLFNDPGGWARDNYGWGVDFDSSTALLRLESLLAAIAGLTRLEQMTDAQVNLFVPGDDDVSPRLIVAPLAAKAVGAGVAEFGAAVFPVSGAGGNAADRGLAAGPYAKGAIGASLTPFEGGELSLSGSVGALGGAIFALRPSGLTVELGVGAAALEGEFGIELQVSPTSGDKIILLGEAGGTRIEADRISVKGGGAVDSASAFDAFVAGGLTQLSMVIDPGDDGLLSGILPGPVTISAGDIGLGWRPNKGVYFEGGSNLGIVIPIERSFGPLTVQDIGLSLDFDAPATLTLTTTADLSIGPLFAHAEDIGIAASLVPAPGNDGIFGANDLDFGFVPPKSYAVALEGGAVSGGGLLSVDDTEYRGALALKFQTFGFSAFAILNTELPGGQDGFSFAASIFSEFSVPLPFGLFLNGVGGMIGVNRTMDTDALREVLYAGRLDNILFPSNPVENAASILSDMAAIMPPREGQHIVGPVVKIGWGQPSLVDVKLGLVIEIGRTARIVLLGGLGSALPTKEAALIEINLTFFAEIDISAGTIDFDGTLANSRILTYTISGDAAIRTGWAPRLEHVASFGGLHPDFPRPANLPDLQALTIAFGTNNPRVTISAYTATTANSLQFGGRADLYAKGPDLWLIGQLAAEGYVYLDALIYFDPFSFDVALGGGLRLLRNGRSVMSLGFDLRLRGPNTFQISGKVWAKVLGKKVRFGVNHRWGAAQSLPAPSADPAALLRMGLERAVLEPVAPARRAAGATFAPFAEGEAAIDPLGGARLSQGAVPLDVTIAKVGEAEIAGGPARMSLRVFDAGGAVVAASPVRASFVHGHFHHLPEAERLGATAFDDEVSGFELANDGLTGPASRAIESSYDYEYVEIPIDTGAPARLRGPSLADDLVVRDLVDRFSARELAFQTDPDRLRARPDAAALAPRVRGDVFVPETDFPGVGDLFDTVRPDAPGLAPDPGGDFGDVGAGHIRDNLLDRGLARPSFAAAQEALVADPLIAGGQEVNPVLTDYIVAAGRL